MDIKSNCGYPASELSNFAAHAFIIDGVKCASMEGFLQSLKFQDPTIQVLVCALVGYDAKRKGKHQRWQHNQTLWWRGQPITRTSVVYRMLITRAFSELLGNVDFREALLATGDSTLEHSIGRSDPKETVLTEAEFCGQLYRLRNIVKNRNVGTVRGKHNEHDS
jgi:predicted NAD-dependent protein-ADP-ribosyltransferase YbiA (DUF1768 family)